MLGRSYRQRAILGDHRAHKSLFAKADAEPRLHAIASHRRHGADGISPPVDVNALEQIVTADAWRRWEQAAELLNKADEAEEPSGHRDAARSPQGRWPDCR
jgi:hypothetical protein